MAGEGVEARPIDQVAHQVGALLEADGDVDARNHMRFAYDLLYGSESAPLPRHGLTPVRSGLLLELRQLTGLSYAIDTNPGPTRRRASFSDIRRREGPARRMPPSPQR